MCAGASQHWISAPSYPEKEQNKLVNQKLHDKFIFVLPDLMVICYSSTIWISLIWIFWIFDYKSLFNLCGDICLDILLCVLLVRYSYGLDMQTETDICVSTKNG